MPSLSALDLEFLMLPTMFSRVRRPEAARKVTALASRSGLKYKAEPEKPVEKMGGRSLLSALNLLVSSTFYHMMPNLFKVFWVKTREKSGIVAHTYNPTSLRPACVLN